MAKPSLKEPWNQLESDIIETLLAGHHEWRSDLAYPESHSDMQGAVRGLLRMFDVKRRALPFELPLRPYATNVDIKVEDTRGGKRITIDLAGEQTDELVKAIERMVTG